MQRTGRNYHLGAILLLVLLAALVLWPRKVVPRDASEMSPAEKAGRPLLEDESGTPLPAPTDAPDPTVTPGPTPTPAKIAARDPAPLLDSNQP